MLNSGLHIYFSRSDNIMRPWQANFSLGFYQEYSGEKLGSGLIITVALHY